MADQIIPPGTPSADASSALTVQGAQRGSQIGSNPLSNGNSAINYIRNLIAQPAIARSLPLIGAVGVLGLAAFIWMALSEPPRRDLFRGLPDGDKAAVAAALESSNIMYQLDNATGAITVSEDDYHNAKMTLAAQGLPRSAPNGDSMISAMPMGVSRAVEGETLRAAREVDLARSIEAIDAVVSARVHLAVDPPSIFIRDRNAPAASVVLQLGSGGNLGESQVRAVTHLVASSVAGLSAENVSVVDQNGRLLSKDGGDGTMSDAERQLEVRERIEERYRRSLAALLTPMLGQANYVAEVSADVDFTERQATSESFPADESRVRSEQVRWSALPDPQLPGGIPGAIGEEPPAEAQLGEQIDPAAEGAGANGPNKSEEQVSRNFELGREVAVTRDAVGQVLRLSVAVAARGADGKTLKDEELSQIETLVKGAVGFNAARGDQVAVITRDLINVTATEVPWYEAGWVAMLARNGTALLAVLALIFGIARPLLKKAGLFKSKAEKAAEVEKVSSSADSAALIAAEQALKPMTGGLNANERASAVTIDMITSAQNYQERAMLIQDFVKQNPEHAALVVKDLLRGGQTQKAAING
jgi:flagellar M-ring protein FliF